jgi:glutamine amidotransferase
MIELAIIDYGVGNLRSVERAFAATGNPATITRDRALAREAKGLVLPGVGAFGTCMKLLTASGFDEVVRDLTSKGVPLLGICVGMQMLFEESDEFGKTKGLGLLSGRVRRFSDELVVPQVGWNQVQQRCRHPLLHQIDDRDFFYFVHSYFCEVSDPNVIAAETEYGVSYPSVVADGDLCGVQFHPEKSQTAGLQLLSNFAHRVRFNAWR